MSVAFDENEFPNVQTLSDLRNNLVGEWSFERELTGYLHLSGAARFTPRGPNLFYREELKIPTPKGMLEGYREYFYNFGQSEVDLYYSSEGIQGELFMKLALVWNTEKGAFEASATHKCGEDHYSGDFEFSGDKTFTIGYRVKGPHKDYSMISRYKKTW